MAATEKKTTTAAKKTTAAAKKTTTTAKKPAVPAAANTSMKVTATEKKVVEAYRGASADLKKIALKVLKGEYGETVTTLLNVVGGGAPSASAANNITDSIGNFLSGLLKK